MEPKFALPTDKDLRFVRDSNAKSHEFEIQHDEMTDVAIAILAVVCAIAIAYLVMA